MHIRFHLFQQCNILIAGVSGLQFPQFLIQINTSRCCNGLSIPGNGKRGTLPIEALIIEQLFQSLLGLNSDDNGQILVRCVRYTVNHGILIRCKQQLRFSLQRHFGIHINAGIGLLQPGFCLLRRGKQTQIIITGKALFPLQERLHLGRFKKDRTVPKHPECLHRLFNPAIHLIHNLICHIRQICRCPPLNNAMNLEGVSE